MMLKIIGRLTFLILQFLVIIAAVVLEDLSTKKMGVNRFLLFRKEKYAELFLSPEQLKIHGILFILSKVTLQAYPFFVLGIWIVIIFQYLWIVMAVMKDRRQR